MYVVERTSAHCLESYIRGERLAASDALADRDILVQIFNREREENNFLVPAVAEPLLVWVISGEATVEERELEREWQSSRVIKGDFFLTTSEQPYEMRWKVNGAEPFQVMHIYLGIPLLEKAIREVLGGSMESIRLREVSGGCDQGLSVLLEQLRLELTGRGSSPLYLQGLAQCIAVHLARNHVDSSASDIARRNKIPAYKLRHVLAAMEANLAEEFHLAPLAEVAGMSKYHFSRLFKKAAGYSPSQFFIRLRIARARQLLIETDQSVIDIGMQVGYGSPSHFSQIFKREVGVTPTQYRK